MAQLIVRHLEDDVRDKLRQRARGHGRSMEEEVRDILRAAVLGGPASREGIGSSIAGHFTGKGLREDIAELRGQNVNPPDFAG